ncbi:hypothetical protein QBC40DRAFT_105643 [Triangularia verruculosa]|uniref:Uncharacterized protein n=1 Tax=Triangularia verruculosa TaxID=2587418 RepID=A0AAN7AZL9_9PEZI|nr:hypothetical protein QBC40DRAFT_105643 [Triangularia verruculosa]
MRRPRFRKSPSTSFSTISEDMVTPPRSPSQMSTRNRDTGFPDAFCGNRNTSLPHPEAKIGPDAWITEDDVNVGRALIRHRMSFQVQTERPYGRSLNLYDRKVSGSSDEGGLTALGRMALGSIRPIAEQPAVIRPTSRDGHSVTSSDGTGTPPDSPTRQTKEDPRDATKDPREGRRRRRRSSLINRLLHR